MVLKKRSERQARAQSARGRLLGRESRGLRFEPLEARSLLTALSIVAENQLPGTPESQWNIYDIYSTTIEGYTTDVSYDQGQTVQFKVDTVASAYRIDIYRMGYYNGDGARLVATRGAGQNVAKQQPNPLFDPSTGLIDAGNWSVTATWQIPPDATSGIYFANLIRTDGVAGGSQVVFIVRDDDGQSDMLFQASVSTWQAYNTWGGNSLYVDNNDNLSVDRAFAVSFNRPYTGLEAFTWEYPMVRYLEANGYDVSYSTNIDTARAGNELLEHKVFLSVGHDEYWSSEQRDHVEAARDAGVNLAFFSGNEAFWKVRYADSIDGSGTDWRTMICYKESKARTKLDPVQDVWTGTWRDTTYADTTDGGRPENALTGTMFTSIFEGAPGTSMTVSAADGLLRFWRNTELASLAPGQSLLLGDYVLGYEIDEDVDNGFRPAGLMNLSSTTFDVSLKLVDGGDYYERGVVTHSLTLYRAASGALVFGAGTIQLTWALDGNHDGPPTTPDLRIQQGVVNLFADMGVQPGTLQAGLMPAIQSTDYVPPTVTITSLANGASVLANGPLLISGTATDLGGGRVAGIEVSIDGGLTWRKAYGRENWDYLWTPSTTGSKTIRVRAVDDSGNLMSTPVSVTVNVTSTNVQKSVWTANNTPAVAANDDATPIEVGTRFTSTSAGFVTGMRFYKGTENVGTHVGSLWTAGGQLLANVTFYSETAEGWQEAMFDTPVAIAANTTYVVSYYAPRGHYAVTPSYFTAAGVTNGFLKATAGVYRSGASGFPTQTYSNSNYWVDVIVAQTNVTMNPAPETGGVATTTKPKLTFGVAMQAATINSTNIQLIDAYGNRVPISVSYNSSNRVATLTPDAPLFDNMRYTVLVRGQTGVRLSTGAVLGRDIAYSFQTAPTPIGPAQTLFANLTPGVVNSGTTQPIELGMQFQATTAGYVTGVRFYKGASNTGWHTGSLWSADGTLLSTVNFLGESESGWQEATFPVPVAIQANTTYIISYFAPEGRYSYTTGGLNSAVTQGNLKALASTAQRPNGVYFSGDTGFPQTSGGGRNYFVAPVFVANLVESITPNHGTSEYDPDDPLVVKFTRDIDPASISSDTVQLFVATRCGGGLCPVCPCTRAMLVDANVTYDTATRSVSIIAMAPLDGAAAYTIVVRGRSGGVKDANGNALANDVVATFSTSSEVGEPITVFSAQMEGIVEENGDPGAVEVGMKFRSDADGYITGVRFYKSLANTGTHVANLWTSTGQLLATATFTNETTRGWQEVIFSAPVAIAKNTTYIVSYYAPNGHYAANPNYFATAVPPRNGPLYALTEGTDGGNGVYRYGTSGFPSESAGATNYWVDPVFVESVIGYFTPGTGQQDVVPGTPITIQFKTAMDAASLTSANVSLVNAQGGTVSTTLSYDSLSRVLTITPTSALGANRTYTIVVRGGQGGVRSQAGHALPAEVRSSFRTATQSLNAYSLYGPDDAPTVATNGDPNAVEVGAKFRASVDGYVTAIRFYKSAANTGTHTGHLWSANGTLLATVAFTNETASGWQEAQLSTPVYVQANQTYVVSYFAPNGNYAADLGQLQTSRVSGPLTALADGTDGPNGVYAGGQGVFPNQTYGATNYWVDVVFSRPLVSAVTPANGTSGIPKGSVVTVSFTGAMDPASINGTTIRLAAQGGFTVAATVTYNATTRIATLTPSAPLADGTTYTVVVMGGANGVKEAAGGLNPIEVQSSFTIAPAPEPEPEPEPQPTSGYTVFGNTIPASPDNGDTAAVEVGMKFRVAANGVVTGMRFYKSAANTGSHVGTLWSASGQKLASVTFTNETASGWQEATFSAPVNVQAGTTYVVSYFASKGHYSIEENGFAAARGSGPVTGLAAGTDGQNGVYRYGSTGFPNESYSKSNYFVDVVFQKTLVSAVTPANGTSGIPKSSAVTVRFTGDMSAATINATTVRLSAPGGFTVAANLTYDAGTRTATLTPNAPLSAGTIYTIVVQGGASGVKDAAGQTQPFDVLSTFTVAADAPPPTPTPTGGYTVLGNQVPTTPDNGDPAAVEVGMKFRADVAGFVTGVRFYKSAANTGAHTGNLWDSSGKLLASVRFTNETASGWQEARFGAPVAIKANTTYVISYFAPNGHYSIETSGFASAQGSGPVRGLAAGTDGQNGVYRYGSSKFPNASYSQSNYFVDVLFEKSLVTNIVPADGATNVARNTSIKITLDANVDPATVVAANFQLVRANGNVIQTWTTYDPATRVVTIQPASNLAANTLYTVRVRGGSTGIKDLSGAVLSADFTTTFKTKK